MFFTRLISGIVLVLVAIFVFVKGGYFLLFALGVLSLLGAITGISGIRTVIYSDLNMIQRQGI